MTEMKWQEHYEITSTKGRIWKRRALGKRAAESPKALLPGKTPGTRRAAGQAVLDDATFTRGRKGPVPARVIEAAAIEEMLRISRKDSAHAAAHRHEEGGRP